MDLAWVQTNWIIAASAGGALLLLIVLLVTVFGRKPKMPAATAAAKTGQPPSRATSQSVSPAEATAPVPAPLAKASPIQPQQAAPKSAPIDLVLDLLRSSPADWKTASGEPSVAVPSTTGLRVRPSAGAVSVASCPAKPGDVYVCEFQVRLVEPAKNGRPVNFFVGPVTRDSSGVLANYWSEQPAFGAGETERSGLVEVTAPDGAKTVHLGAHGSWKSDGSEGDGVVEFVKLRVCSK